jgi:hypothetical protein
MNLGVIASWSPPARGLHSGQGAPRPVLALHRGGPRVLRPLNSPCMECALIGPVNTPEVLARLAAIRRTLQDRGQCDAPRRGSGSGRRASSVCRPCPSEAGEVRVDRAFVLPIERSELIANRALRKTCDYAKLAITRTNSGRPRPGVMPAGIDLAARPFLRASSSRGSRSRLVRILPDGPPTVVVLEKTKELCCALIRPSSGGGSQCQRPAVRVSPAIVQPSRRLGKDRPVTSMPNKAPSRSRPFESTAGCVANQRATSMLRVTSSRRVAAPWC